MGVRITGLVWRQIRHQNRLFWRTPLAAFFTLAFPLILVSLFSVILGSQDIGGGVRISQFYIPAMSVYAAATATFTNLAIGTSLSRDQGILRRVRGTPLPPWIHMAGRIGSGVWTGLISIVLLFIMGWAVFGFQMVWDNLGVAALAFVVSMAAFSALGLAVCAVVKNGEATPAVANAVILPMAFISDIFIPLEGAPRWLQVAGDIFPLKHFGELFRRSFDPFYDGAVLDWVSLAIIGAWFLVGLFVASRYFSWDPHGNN